MTDPGTRTRAHALLERVLDLDARQREAELRAACAGEPELRALVDALLEADTSTNELLDRGSQDLFALMAEDDEGADSAPLPYGGRIGVYRLIAEAGRGGMATVYFAEREVGDARQRVALKLVKRGVDTDEVLRRFAHETRVLASLEHPNIARFYDVGTTPDGRPYLAMEYIEGLSLTAYCDAHRLDVDARLGLFTTVCSAVQYAHQRLVVHRDIKPSNVLVTAAGQVKLLDFGIAKPLTDEPDRAAPRTRTGVLVLTPEYAAPEQLRGEPVGTASDVYTLGLVLYELLAGCRPRAAAAEDAAGGARDDRPFEPPAPSTAVRRATRAGTATDVARARGMAPDRLRRRLEGDLDRIVLRALEHDPARRYQSAQQLQEDLERHARGLPVLARPATLHYRLGKYIRRHRAGLLAAAAAILLLAGFSGFHTVRITRERDRAQAGEDRAQVTSQFLGRLLAEAYPGVARGDTMVSIGALLERAVARVDSVTDHPGIQAELLRRLGDIYREQGRFDQALPLLQRAVALHRRSGEQPSRAAGEALSALGHLHYDRGDYEAAWRDHQASLEIWQQIFARDDTLVLFALNNMATAAASLRNHEEALRLHQQVLSRRRRLFADTSRLVHTTHNNLGTLYHTLGDLAASEREHREALRIRRAGLPADHPSVALSLTNLAATLEKLDRLGEAERLHREALAIFQRVLGPDHHRVGLSAYHLARVLERTGALDEAESLYRLTIDIDRTVYGAEHLEVGIDLQRLGTVLRQKADCDAAARTLREADAIFARNGLPLTDRRRLTTRAQMGACFGALGRYGEAEEILLGTYRAAQEPELDVDAAAVRQTVEHLVELYESWGRPAEADVFRSRLNATTP
jgi:eukaryotic-like serine/threonine-protein kinase